MPEDRTDIGNMGRGARNQAVRWGLGNGLLSLWHKVTTDYTSSDLGKHSRRRKNAVAYSVIQDLKGMGETMLTRID